MVKISVSLRKSERSTHNIGNFENATSFILNWSQRKLVANDSPTKKMSLGPTFLLALRFPAKLQSLSSKKFSVT